MNNNEMRQVVLDVMHQYGVVMDRPVQLKVKRNELAKQFDLIHIGKPGDVGYDLPTVFPFKEEYKDQDVRRECMQFMAREGKSADEVMAEIHESMIIEPGQRVLIPTGVSLEIPVGFWVALTARSSTSKLKLIVPLGIIDQGYRGELFAQVINIGTEPVIVRHGDRLAQIIMYEAVAHKTQIIEVDELASSERGATGFGSTGQSAKLNVKPIVKPNGVQTSFFDDIDPNNEDNID